MEGLCGCTMSHCRCDVPPALGSTTWRRARQVMLDKYVRNGQLGIDRNTKISHGSSSFSIWSNFFFLAGHPQILVVKWKHFCGKTGWLGWCFSLVPLISAPVQILAETLEVLLISTGDFRHNDWNWYPINTLWGFINLGFTLQKVCFTMEIMIRVAKHWTAAPNKPRRVTAIFRPRHLERYCAAAFLRCMAHLPQQKTTPDQRVTRNADVLYVFYPGFKLSNTSLGWGETLSGFLLNCLFAPERTIWILIPSRLYEIPPPLLIYISEFFVSTYLDHQKGHLNPFPLI